MKTLRRLLFPGLVLVMIHVSVQASVVGHSVTSQTLVLNPNDAFKMALVQSEVLSQQSERIDQAESVIRQAWGSVLPNLRVIGNYQKQDRIKDPLAGRFSPTFNPALRINLIQPVFRGFREFAALRQGKANKEASEADRLNAERVLYTEVIAQYFETEFLSQSLRLLKDQEKAFQKRIQEIQNRVSTGQARQSELLAIQSAHSRLTSRLRQTEGVFRASEESFGFLLGRPVGSFSTTPQSVSVSTLPDVEKWVQKIESRPDVQSLKIQMDAEAENVKIAKGAHWGEADIVGNYWLRRAGILDQINWDVSLQFSFPIFQGGVISAQVDQAVSQQKERDLQLSRLRRSAEAEIRSLHAILSGEWNRYTELKSAVSLAQKNVDVQTKDYRYGLVRNIDVLMALDDFYNLQIDFERSKVDLQQSIYRLNAAAGDIQVL